MGCSASTHEAQSAAEQEDQKEQTKYISQAVHYDRMIENRQPLPTGFPRPSGTHRFLQIFILGQEKVGKVSLWSVIAFGDMDLFYTSGIGADVSPRFLVDGIFYVMTFAYGADPKRAILANACCQDPNFGSSHTTATATIFAYQVQSRDSFEYVKGLRRGVETARREAGVTTRLPVLMLAATMVDKDSREVTSDEGRAFAEETGMLFAETSALTHEGIYEAFTELVQEVHRGTDKEAREARGD